MASHHNLCGFHGLEAELLRRSMILRWLVSVAIIVMKHAYHRFLQDFVAVRLLSDAILVLITTLIAAVAAWRLFRSSYIHDSCTRALQIGVHQRNV